MIKIMTPIGVDSEQRYALRTRGFDKDGNEYIYLRGCASTIKYSPVIYDENGYTVLADSAGTAPANDGPLAIAQAIVDATTEWGWYMIYGKTYVICLTDVTDNEQVYLTTTAGSVDDADVASAAVIGMWFRGANTAGAGGTALVQLSYPVVHSDAIN